MVGQMPCQWGRARSCDSAAVVAYGSDTAKNYEVGIKGDRPG